MNEFNTFMNYYPGTGQVKSINHEAGTQVFDYAYDAWGNITTQRLGNGSGQFTERFSYDELQRLRSASINNGAPTHYEYSIDGLGNLVHKSDYANTQSYDATGNAGPNAITSAVLNSGGTMSYVYDKKGNRIKDLFNGNERADYVYDANNLLVRSIRGSDEVSYRYGVDQARYLKHEYAQDPNDTHKDDELTLYGLPGFEEIIELSTLTNQQLKVQVTSNVQVTLRTGINRFEHHTMLKDRLGSTSLIFDDQAAVVATKGYDAFGKPRDGDTWAAMTNPALDFDQNDTEAIDVSKRGFTGHEHIDAFELIHMNGRMYDFNNGRFLSVDPFIHGVTSQGINPYSYILNNPLAGVDPTGYRPETYLHAQYIEEFGIEGSEDLRYPMNNIDGRVIAVGAVSAAIVVLEVIDYIDTATDFINPVKGLLKKAGPGQLIKEGLESGKAALRNGLDYLKKDKPGTSTSDLKSQTSTVSNRKSGVPDENFKMGENVTEPYKRPSQAGPTAAQKESVQNKPCVDCGTVTDKQVADHKDPLVVEHYRDGKVDIEKQRQIDAVQPHCPTCSNQQGGQLGAFGKKMKKELKQRQQSASGSQGGAGQVGVVRCTKAGTKCK